MIVEKPVWHGVSNPSSVNKHKCTRRGDAKGYRSAARLLTAFPLPGSSPLSPVVCSFPSPTLHCRRLSFVILSGKGKAKLGMTRQARVAAHQFPSPCRLMARRMCVMHVGGLVARARANRLNTCPVAGTHPQNLPLLGRKPPVVFGLGSLSIHDWLHNQSPDTQECFSLSWEAGIPRFSAQESSVGSVHSHHHVRIPSAHHHGTTSSSNEQQEKSQYICPERSSS